MLTREQRADWRRWQRLAGRVLVLNEYMAKHLPAQATLAIVDRHLQALEAEHTAAVALRASNDAHFVCKEMTELAAVAERNGPLYKAWRAAVEAAEKGGDVECGVESRNP